METECFLTENTADKRQHESFDISIFRNEMYGKYWLINEVISIHSGDHRLTKRQKLNLLRETISLNRQALFPCWGKGPQELNRANVPSDLVYRNIDDYKDIPLDHSTKESNILRTISEKIDHQINPFALTNLSEGDRYWMGIYTQEEYAEWVKSLYEKGFLEFNNELRVHYNNISSHAHGWTTFVKYLSTKPAISLTAKAWNRIHQDRTGINSRKVFLAMSFGYDERPSLQKALENACRKTGYIAETVDRTEFLGGITDEIIGLINASKFVICDFTENKRGVYYEAGYAHGLGRPVIYTVRKRSNGGDLQLHFDTQHLNHIVWNSFEELEQKVTNRINALINKGQ